MSTTLQIVREARCEALDLRAGEHVLDVAAGNGNTTLAAAERAGVCKAGGRIGLTHWTPESLVGGIVNTIGKYIPPAGVVQRIAHLLERLCARISPFYPNFIFPQLS